MAFGVPVVPVVKIAAKGETVMRYARRLAAALNAALILAAIGTDVSLAGTGTWPLIIRRRATPPRKGAKQ